MNNLNNSRLYCAATKIELERIFPMDLQGVKVLDSKTYQFENEIFSITGIGIAETLVNLFKLSQKYSITSIVQVGIAGAYLGSGLNNCDVVGVVKDCIGDLGTDTHNGFLTLADMKLDHSDAFFASSELVDEYFTGTKSLVNGVTVNSCTGKKQTGIQRELKFNAQVESMEGAALYMFSQEFGVPALQVRSISNSATERNTAEWDIPGALDSLAEFFSNA